jgi:hypothetical protein
MNTTRAQEDRWAERRWKWDDAARRKTTSEEQAPNGADVAGGCSQPKMGMLPTSPNPFQHLPTYQQIYMVGLTLNTLDNNYYYIYIE